MPLFSDTALQMIPRPEMIPDVDRKWSRGKTRSGMKFFRRYEFLILIWT